MKEARGWIQWKGTDVCMDVHCQCGELSHIDGEFCYEVKCPYCGRVYSCDGNIKLILIENPDQDKKVNPLMAEIPPFKENI